MLDKLKTRFFPILFVSVSVFFIGLLTFLVASYLKNRALEFENLLEDRNYHIIVTGDYENHLFLSEVFEGAEDVSADYNSIVELYVPQSYAQNESLQALFDYVSFSNADAVIAFIPQNEDVLNLTVPKKKESQSIPLITIGSYHPQIPQVAYIGINYSEVGKKTAEEAVFLAGRGGSIFLIQGELGTASQNSSFLNSFYSAIQKENPDQRVFIIENIPEENELKELYELFENQKAVFITLSELSCVQASQILSSYREINTEIISVGNTEITENLFNKGNISEIIAVDPKKIGNLAIAEIFEFLALRNSNNYITAEVQVRKAKK